MSRVDWGVYLCSILLNQTLLKSIGLDSVIVPGCVTGDVSSKLRACAAVQRFSNSRARVSFSRFVELFGNRSPLQVAQANQIAA
jgi:hypothetical protein